MGARSCAASTPATTASPPRTAPPRATAELATTETVTLTNAQVIAPPPPPAESATLAPAPWTDGDIVAALRAADGGRDADAQAACARSESVRADRFAEDVLQQEREFARGEREESGLMLSLGATKSPLTDRVKEARHLAEVSTIGARSAGFDRDFMDGPIRCERKLMSLIDDEMLPHPTCAAFFCR